MPHPPSDFMVKIRGYSVNVGAIEAALTMSPFIKSTAVLAGGCHSPALSYHNAG